MMAPMQPQYYPNQQGHAMMPVHQYQQQQPQPPQQAIIEVDYLPTTGCCFRSCIGQPIPKSAQRMAVIIDGVEAGQLEQGQSGTYLVAAGVPHYVSAKICGRNVVDSFIKSIAKAASGDQGFGHMSCVPGSGQYIYLWISYTDTGSCCLTGRSWHPKMTQEAALFRKR
jgi:hypothetical protein